MIETNDSVNCFVDERATNEWRVRRIGIKSEAFCIIRADSYAELKYVLKGMFERVRSG